MIGSLSLFPLFGVVTCRFRRCGPFIRRAKRGALALLFATLFGSVAYAQTPTRVWGLYGWGDNWRGTCSGIDEIATVVRTIPGVEFVHIFNYYQTQEVYDEIVAAPTDVKIAIYGYCMRE